MGLYEPARTALPNKSRSVVPDDYKTRGRRSRIRREPCDAGQGLAPEENDEAEIDLLARFPHFARARHIHRSVRIDRQPISEPLI